MQEIRVSKREAGGTLLKLLRKYLKEAPESFFYKMLRKKNITLNGKKAEGKEKLAEGDSIRLFLSDETIRNLGGKNPAGTCSVQENGGENNKRQPEILYEDEDLIFLNKPAGWLTQKAAKEDFSLNEWLISYLLRTGSITPEELLTFHPGVCNRLDRNTSGIVAAGKTLMGLQFLSEAFRTRSLHKYYTCIAVNEITQPVSVQGYLKKDPRTNQVQVFQSVPDKAAGFEYIKTAYRPIAAKGGFTYLEIELFTGKTHQIRAQLAADGHAVLGDPKYADDFGQELRKKYHMKYQLLHAGRLVFDSAAGRFSYMSGKKITAREPDLFLKVKRKLGFDEVEETEGEEK